MKGKDLLGIIRKTGEKFSRDFYARPQTYLAYVIVAVVVSLLFTFSFFIVPPKIRAEQVDSLIYSELPSDRLQPMDYRHIDDEIAKSKAISVMFSEPHGKEYENVTAILASAKGAELNRRIYYYPIVYGEKKLASTYRIDPTQVTFIFFKDGKEKNRLEVQSLDQLSQELIPELNRLPMWTLREMEEGKRPVETGSSTTAPTDQGAPTADSAAEQEPIDPTIPQDPENQ